MRKRPFLLVVAILMLWQSFAYAQCFQIYISPNGSDQGDGSRDNALQTLQKARDMARELRQKKDCSDTIKVTLLPGIYELKDIFTLNPTDGGTEGAPVIYEGPENGEAVISGGIAIDGFRETENGLWIAHIPEVPYWKWDFQQLYVNGHRATRARSPNNGYFFMEDVKEDVFVKGKSRWPEKAQQTIKIGTDAAPEISALSQEELENVVVTAFHKWNITKKYIEKYDHEKNTIIVSGYGMKPWNPLKKGIRFTLENYKGALDASGEWFLDKEKGLLYYKPFPGETVNSSTFTAPVLEQLIRIDGDAENNEYVEHVIFKNLHFRHSAYYLPKGGFEPYQAALGVDAAIEMNSARNILFDHCAIEQTGGYALWFNQGVSESGVKHCYIHDLGAGGVKVGETVIRQEKSLQTHDNIIENNIIQSGGYEFPPAVGVWIAQSAGNRIIHNDIGDFRYTGVSVGWVWGYAESPAKRNKIKYNHIHHIGWGVLSDMAGVYTLGRSEGTEVSNNHVHHIYAYDYGGWGLYTDEGSTNIVMENNLVHHTKTGGFHQHYGRENVLRNNIFAFAKMYQLQATRIEDHLSFTFTNNIVLYDRGVFFQGKWDKMKLVLYRNNYWKLNGEVDFLGHDFKWWKKLGYDKHSIIADPQFRDPLNGDFTFKHNRVIKKIGFKPFDYSTYGVYGTESWKAKAKLPEDVLKAFDKLYE